MPAVVARKDREGWRLQGSWPDAEVANRFLAHLVARAFSSATIRAYAYDLVNFGRFCVERGVCIPDAAPTDFFDYLEWQSGLRPARGERVVRLAARRPAPATMNRRIAAVRALFEFAVLAGVRPDSPVPSPRRSSGLRARRRGLLGHVPARHPRRGGRLVQQPRLLPESLEPAEVDAFLADLSTHRDRAVVLAMLLGGLRAGEVRGLRLADVDMGLRRLRVVGKGGRERVVPVDRAFFSELAGYLRVERPPGCPTPACLPVSARGCKGCGCRVRRVSAGWLAWLAGWPACPRSWPHPASGRAGQRSAARPIAHATPSGAVDPAARERRIGRRGGQASQWGAPARWSRVGGRWVLSGVAGGVPAAVGWVQAGAARLT